MGHSPWGCTDRGAWQTTLCQTHTNTLSVSLYVSLTVSLTVSLSLFLCLSLSLSLSPSFSSDLRRRRILPRKTFTSHWRYSICSLQTQMVSLMLQLV